MFLISRDERDTGSAVPLPVARAEVVRTDLVETETVDGTLGYGPAQPLENRLAGTVTSVPREGSIVRRGGRLCEVDTRPVVLMYGSLPAYRAMEPGQTGRDVRQLEQNLRALGQTGFTVDSDYTWATAQAVRRWQHALGITETGDIALGRVVFLPEAIRIAEVTARAGRSVAPGAPVVSYTSTTRVVTIDLDVTQRSLAHRGVKVTITVSGSETLTGRVEHVGTVATAEAEDAGGSEQAGTGTPTIPVTCTIDDQKALRDLDAAPVRVALASQRRDGVLAVPVASLLALREGGYGLRLLSGDGSPRTVPVTTGLFAGGLVEVSGPGLAEGTVIETAPS